MLGHRDQETVSTVLYIYGFLALALVITLPYPFKRGEGLLDALLHSGDFRCGRIPKINHFPPLKSFCVAISSGFDNPHMWCVNIETTKDFLRSYVYQNNCSDRSMEV